MSEKTLSHRVDDVNTNLRKLTTALSECEKKTVKAYSNYLNIKKMIEDIMLDQKKIRSDIDFIKKQKTTTGTMLTKKQKTILLFIVGGTIVSILLMLIFIGVKLNVLPTNVIKNFL